MRVEIRLSEHSKSSTLLQLNKSFNTFTCKEVVKRGSTCDFNEGIVDLFFGTFTSLHTGIS